MKSMANISLSQGGKPASEFATKNYLAQMIHLLSIKDPSCTALRLVMVSPFSYVRDNSDANLNHSSK